MMNDLDMHIDSLNAPQYVDFENMTDTEDVEKYFDVDFERHPAPSRRDTFEVLIPKTPQIMQQHIQEQTRNSEGNKENCTPPSARKRRHSSQNAPTGVERAHNVLADISTYLTPGTSKRKSQVAYMDNGRSVLVQNYDGITIVTPNKTHLMETRLDSYIKSPGLTLRTRSVTRDQLNCNSELNVTSRKNKKPQHEEMDKLPEEETSIDPSANKYPKQQTSLFANPGQAPGVSVASEVPATKRPAPPSYRAPMVVHHPTQPTNLKNSKIPAPNKAVKFVAAAEVVHHFQKDTPERFHSRPARSGLQNKLQITKTAIGPRPNTIPKSPFLVTKMRQNSRYIEPVPTQAEREEQELAEIKKHPIKANPVHRKILIPLPVKEVFNSKNPTKPEPFKLSHGKRREPTPEPVFRFKAQAVPRGILDSPKGVPARQEIPLTEPHSPTLRVTAKYPKRVKVETPGNVEKEVAHFGLENVNRITPNRVTKVQPFSFEERDKKMMEHKQELIQKRLEEERKAREFKANKKPAFSSPSLPVRKQIPTTKPHTPQLSAWKFGTYNQQKFQQHVEDEERRLKEAAQFHARPATVTLKKPFGPTLPNRKVTAGNLKLSTEQRAAERALFEEKLRQKEAEAAELQAQRNALREAEEREEEARLRREAEFKATGLRSHSPMKIMPSSKPLTEPQSPNLSLKERASRSIRQQ